MQKTIPQLNKTSHPELLRSHRSWWRASFEFVCLLVLCILGLETFFNYAGVGNEEFLEPDSVLGVRHIPGKKVVWRLEGYSDEKLSSQGLRDTEHPIVKPANTYRIALLGDSATEGLQVPLKDTYGKQLERMLNNRSAGAARARNVEVLNFGCSSYSNGQEAIQLETKVAAYHPDLVVLMYNRGDYLENIRDPSTLKAEPRPYFHMNASGNLLQDNTIMDCNRASFAANPVLDFLRVKSRIYGVWSHLNLALSLNEPLYSKLRNTFMGLLPNAKTRWKNVQAAYTISDPWKVTETIIDRIQADCSANGSKFMLLCFPNLVKDGEYARQIDSLKSFAQNKNFAYLDLTPDYLGSKDAKSLFLKYHFSSAGHELAARKIAESISK